jgi:7-cyano-7-deazaguanine synthase in queuosine biosynthesis
MSGFELLLEGATSVEPESEQLIWGRSASGSDSVRASVDPWLRQFGPVSPAAIDLVRIAAGAYMADRLQPRRAGYSRTIDLHVQLMNAGAWRPLADGVADLLHWLTADEWRLQLSSEGLKRPTSPGKVPKAATVSLLSGGLDSFCGAVLTRKDHARLLIGHWDNGIVKGSQNRAWRWLQTKAGLVATPTYVELSQKAPKREPSTRSRSFLFLALASATADACGASTLEVPENGFTSLNPPLGANRGGALSTRSTHPWTLFLFGELLSGLGLPLAVTSPYQEMTKGELVKAAAEAGVPSFAEGAASTLSCAKLDGYRYKGGNANHNCGLCMPCVVRRASFIAAGVDDETPYLVNHLPVASKKRLIDRRTEELDALRAAMARGIDDVDILSQGPFPDEFDLDSGLGVCQRALKELEAVPLP